MAHTLTLGWEMLGHHQTGQVANIAEPHSETVKTWRVIYKDNLTVIVESKDTAERRVYKVREWQQQNQCRATRMG